MSIAASAAAVARPTMYDPCPCGRSMKTRAAARCRSCWDEVNAAMSAARGVEERRRRAFIHRVNYALRTRMGRSDLLPSDAPLPVGPCHYCGAPEPAGWDHVVPLARGGPNTIANLVPCCTHCNHRKGSRSTALLATPEWMELACARCGVAFKRRSAAHRQHLARGGRAVYCSTACRAGGR